MKITLHSVLLGSVISLVGVAACGTDVDGGGDTTSSSSSTSSGIACTEEARSSVTVKVVTASGTAVTDATLTFSVDGGAAQDCENMMDGSYVCGYEQAGMITVTATKDAATQMQTVTVGKTADGCHVESQTITMTLGA